MSGTTPSFSIVTRLRRTASVPPEAYDKGVRAKILISVEGPNAPSDLRPNEMAGALRVG